MQQHTLRPGTAQSLRRIAASLPPGTLVDPVPEVRVTGIAADSREVEHGDLFVATRGLAADGHGFIRDAIRRGAVAVIVEELPPEPVDLPVIRTANTRTALAKLAAAWYGHPSRELTLVGVTGTMGKTSTLAFLEAILGAGGQPVGSIGSLGVRANGREIEQTGYTVPGPLRLHGALRQLCDLGCKVVLMEATTHALTQGRLHGVEFGLGVFTSLVPLEHMEYHDSFQSYVEAKARYFNHLAPGAPLAYFADDPALRMFVEGHDLTPIPCGAGEDAAVRIQVEAMDTAGTVLHLSAPGGVPDLDGSSSLPWSVRVRLPLLGRSTAVNASLAAAAGAVLGATPRAIETALDALPSVPRRMQIVQAEPFLILDDFGGHPNTVSAVFEVVEALSWERLHVVTGYRAMRGTPINRGMSEALSVWLHRLGCETLCVTAAEETADERNRVQPDERKAFHRGLESAGTPLHEERRMDRAIHHTMERVRTGDLLLILGTQGLDGAAAFARECWTRKH